MKKILMFVAALVFTSGMAFADGHKGSCGAGKCGKSEKSEMKGSCGAGKCGGEMKKEMKGSCGAGKCGSEMSKEKAHGQQGEMMKKSGNKESGSCGNGKCGK